MMNYAVLDWDYTVRRKNTLFTWIDYLCEEGIISDHIQAELAAMQQRYVRGEISHDEYAELACAAYACAVKGLPADRLQGCLPAYKQKDQHYFFSFTRDLFLYLKKQNIETYVISGAPLDVVRQYQQEFSIRSIYAFEAEIQQGQYTGRVKCNYGFNKGAAVSQLMEKYGHPPLLGFGDSSSDLPLLQAAGHAFCINTEGALPGLQQGIYLPPTVSSSELLESVEKVCRFSNI